MSLRDLEIDVYAHDGCTGRFVWTGVTFPVTGGCEFHCSHCGAEPQGLQAWMPPEGESMADGLERVAVLR